mgnify:CR=1 FL=1
MKHSYYVIAIAALCVVIMWQHLSSKRNTTDLLIQQKAQFDLDRARYDSIVGAYKIGMDTLRLRAFDDSIRVSELLKLVNMDHPKWPGSDFSDKDSEALKAIILWENAR